MSRDALTSRASNAKRAGASAERVARIERMRMSQDSGGSRRGDRSDMERVIGVVRWYLKSPRSRRF